MGVVTRIILSFGALEDFVEREGEIDSYLLIDSINHWLSSRSPYRMMGDHAASMVFTAQIKSLNDDAFVAMVMSLPWIDPGQVVLTVYRENYGVQVYRPLVPQ